jgi:hypothetical protein
VRGGTPCWHRQEDGLPYIPPHLRNGIAGQRRRHQSPRSCSGMPLNPCYRREIRDIA